MQMIYILRKPCFVLTAINGNKLIDIQKETNIVYNYLFKIIKILKEQKIAYVKKHRIYLTEKGEEIRKGLSELAELLK